MQHLRCEEGHIHKVCLNGFHFSPLQQSIAIFWNYNFDLIPVCLLAYKDVHLLIYIFANMLQYDHVLFDLFHCSE